jgi:phenylpyruvate tautomerase PptA (4-oxalocrotonate tautomerase family)
LDYQLRDEITAEVKATLIQAVTEVTEATSA